MGVSENIRKLRCVIHNSPFTPLYIFAVPPLLKKIYVVARLRISSAGFVLERETLPKPLFLAFWSRNLIPVFRFLLLFVVPASRIQRPKALKSKLSVIITFPSHRKRSQEYKKSSIRKTRRLLQLQNPIRLVLF